MGEDKANIPSRRLLLPLQFPTNPPMVVEVEGLGRDFLERVWKLMLISEKIMRTMHGRARVIIENAPCHSATIHSETHSPFVGDRQGQLRPSTFEAKTNLLSMRKS